MNISTEEYLNQIKNLMSKIADENGTKVLHIYPEWLDCMDGKTQLVSIETTSTECTKQDEPK